ncbi:MAG: SUMF1/EgtB/PvdO family nonheme iron enzyme [bacterium]
MTPPDNSLGGQSTNPGADLPDGIHSIGDVLTQRQRKRFRAGDVLAGRYKILGELGQGGMGLVFRCLDEVGGIEVAVKMLPPEVSRDTGEMEEVRENFQLVAKLAHPSIATVRTLERDPATGEYLLVMDSAEGVSLRKWRKEGAGGRRTLAEILPVLEHVASALDYAHGRKVVHRDIKPSNIMVSPDGTVNVLDFGLAAQIHTSFSRVSQTKYGTSGTGPYMAPEQWRGEYQDAKTDQYALGVMTYELLAGRLPFESHDASVLKQAVLDHEPTPIAGLDPAAMAVLRRALAKKREERFASCAEFVEALGGGKISPQRTPRNAEGRRSRFGGLWLGVGVAVILVLGWWGWMVWRQGSAPEEQSARVSAQTKPNTAAEQPDGQASQAQPITLEDLDKLDFSPIVTLPTSVRNGAAYIATDPAGAAVAIGAAGKTAPAEFLNLPAGVCTARVSLSGYYDTSVLLLVTGDRFTKTNVVLRRHSGKVRLSSTPTEAEIWRDGQRLGMTPEILGPFPAESIVFELKKPGYRPATVTVEVRKDEATDRTASLEKASGWLRVVAQGRPAGEAGELEIDGRSVGVVKLPYVAGPFDPAKVKVRFVGAGGASAEAAASVEDTRTNVVTLVFEAQPRDGEDWTVKNLGMLVKWIPAGTFMMGSTPEERAWAAGSEGKGQKEWFAGEGDQPRSTKVDPGFWLGQTEVTRGQWKQFMADNPSFRTDAEKSGQAWCLDIKGDKQWKLMKGKSWRDPNFEQDDTHPVVCISWNDATAFCAWLTRKERDGGRLPESLVYRLPSEAEWEYACRAQKEQTRFWWGDAVMDGEGRVNVGGTEKMPNGTTWSVSFSFDDGWPYTAPVDSYGTRGRNGFGLADMLGNVWEWCLDGWSEQGAQVQVYKADASRRVVRGGSFNFQPGGVRCAYRARTDPSLPDGGDGFRVGLGVSR